MTNLGHLVVWSSGDLKRRGKAPVKKHQWLGLSIVATVLAVLTAPAAFGQELTAVDNKSAKSAPAPRMANGRPDFSGYWKGTRDTVPGGNIGKDLPGLKLPLTPAGEAALQHNLTATIDPEALCIIGGIPRHNASGLPFEVLQGAEQDRVPVFLQLLPPDSDGRPQAQRRPRSVVLRRGGRQVGRRYARHRFDRLQGREGLD